MLKFIRPTLSLPYLDWGQTTRNGGVSRFGESPAHQQKFSCSARGGNNDFQENALNLASHVNDSPEAVRENWRRFGLASTWSRETLATCQQVHGSTILEVIQGGHHQSDADALISRTPGIAVGVFTADCVPILVVDPDRRHVAAIHCGWKGVAANLTAKTIAQLAGNETERCAQLLVWIGASIRCESYEVGPEVAQQFDVSASLPGKPGKFQLDLHKVVREQLLNTGIDDQNIEDCKLDTYTYHENTFSYRFDKGKTGRMMTFVGFLK